MSLRSFVVVLLGVGVASTPGRAQSEATGLLRNRLEARGGMALVAGRLEDATRAVAAAGISTAGGSAARPDAVFAIGSVSKVLTALLLADMVVRGEVSLDQDIATLLPPDQAVPRWPDTPITLRMLATHTSGLPRLPSNLDLSRADDPYAAYTTDALLDFLRTHSLGRAPGSRFEYSNLGSGLLGHLLARRLGLGYEEAVRVRILAPLGMGETGITLPSDLRARLVPGHDADLQPASHWRFDVLAPAGAWYSTAADLLRLAEAALAAPHGPLGEALALSLDTHRPAGQGPAMGLGWMLRTSVGRQIAWHNGETGGFHAFLAVDPARARAVTLLSNVADDDDDLGFHLLDPDLPLGPGPRPAIALDPAALAVFEGTYLLGPGFTLSVTHVEGRLWVQAAGQPRFGLYAAGASRFFLRAIDAEIEFTSDEAGRVTGLVLHQNGRAMPGRRVDRAPDATEESSGR